MISLGYLDDYQSDLVSADRRQCYFKTNTPELRNVSTLFSIAMNLSSVFLLILAKSYIFII
ncbi:hypothetical protein NIES4102_21630 [Chondrocystis sp. NIES-4102]|nr:hypothetical protein NIES4102_21630 [Chondrocystis sp. NIES-4102]